MRTPFTRSSHGREGEGRQADGRQSDRMDHSRNARDRSLELKIAHGSLAQSPASRRMSGNGGFFVSKTGTIICGRKELFRFCIFYFY